MPKTLRETLKDIYDEYKNHNINRVKLRVVNEKYEQIAMQIVTDFNEDILDDWAMNLLVKSHTYTGMYELIIVA